MTTWLPTRRPGLVTSACIVLGVAALLIGGYLAYRYMERILHRPPPIPRQTNVESIQGWMTIQYVARGYRVPEPELFRALGVDPDKMHNLSVNQIADATGNDREATVESVRQTVTTFQLAHPPRPPPPTRPPPP